MIYDKTRTFSSENISKLEASPKSAIAKNITDVFQVKFDELLISIQKW